MRSKTILGGSKMTTGKKTAILMLIVCLLAIGILKFRAENELGSVETINYSIDSEKELVYLSWEEARNAEGYEVYACFLSKNDAYVLVGEVEEPSATIKGFTIGENYGIKVRPYKNNNGNVEYGDYSNAITFSYEGQYELV